MRKGLAAMLCLLAWLVPPPSGARAGDEPFTALFSTSCVRHFYALDKLAAALAASAATALEGEDAAPFLGRASGAAWAVRGPSGRYVVAIRADRVCAVFAPVPPRRRSRTASWRWWPRAPGRWSPRRSTAAPRPTAAR